MIGISPLPTVIGPGPVGQQGPVGKRLYYFGCNASLVTSPYWFYPYSEFFNNAPTAQELMNVTAGYLANLFIDCDANNADSDTEIRVYLNGTPTSLVVTLPAGSTIVVPDTTHQVPVVSNDYVSVRAARAGGSFGVGPTKCVATFERVAT